MILTGTGNKTYKDLLKKSPEIIDVLHLVPDIASSWYEFGMQLRVSISVRESLIRDISFSDDAKLEKVLMYWIQAEPSPVTWKMILQALVNLERISIASKVREYLEKPETYSKYIATRDFTGIIIIIIIYKLSMNNL